MAFRQAFWAAVAVVAAGAAYSAYAPETAEKWAPALGVYARRAHEMLPNSATKPPDPPAPAQAQGPAPILVSVAPVKRADYPVFLESLGQVQAYNTVTVRARVDGQIVKIAFEEGQMVKAGDLLAQIDPRPFQAALDQAKAKKTQDEANLVNARLDLQRYATLAKQSYATQQQLDTQNALVNQLIAQIAADAAAIDAAQVQLDYTTIRAPISGRAGFRLVDQGNMVAAAQQTGIVTIAQLQPITVVFTAPEDEVGRINALLAAGAPKVEVQNSDGVDACDRQADNHRQSGRHDDRHDPAEGGIREQGQCALAGPRRHDRPDSRRGQKRSDRAGGRDPARPEGPLRLCRRRPKSRGDAPGDGFA